MKCTIYLSQDIADIMKCYGSLTDVTNKILLAGETGEIDLIDKPAVPPRVNGSYYTIDVTNKYYISLLNLYGSKSSKVSLRRLLYWFVNNDMFEQLEWAPESIPPTRMEQATDVINGIREELVKLQKYTKDTIHVRAIRKNLNEIEENLCND